MLLWKTAVSFKSGLGCMCII